MKGPPRNGTPPPKKKQTRTPLVLQCLGRTQYMTDYPQPSHLDSSKKVVVNVYKWSDLKRSRQTQTHMKSVTWMFPKEVMINGEDQ